MPPDFSEQSAALDVAPPDGYARREFFVAGCLLLVAVPLLAGLVVSGIAGGWTMVDKQVRFDYSKLADDLLDLMLGPWILPALGLGLVLQSRGIDLSVWMGLGMGSAVAAGMIARGDHPAVALAAVVLAGAALGAINAAAVVALRIPSLLATAATGAICYAFNYLLTGPDKLVIAPGALAVWSAPHWPRILAAGFYVTAMLAGLIAIRLRPRVNRPQPAALAAALIASGVLSALGGLCWLARAGWAPAPTLRIIDLRVLAAPILAGALVLRGPGRSMVVAVFMPAAMLLSTAWGILVWDVRALPWGVNVSALSLMAIGAQWAVVRSAAAGPIRRTAVMALTLISLPVIACSAGSVKLAGLNISSSPCAKWTISLAGAAAWLAAIALAIFTRSARRPRIAVGDDG